MKKPNKFFTYLKNILFVFSLLPLQSNAINYNIKYSSNKVFHEFEFILKSTIEKTIGENIPILDISIQLDNNYSSYSHTNALQNKCNIVVSYKDRNPIILGSFKNDIQFVLFHEIGHCLLNKKILHEKVFDWIIEVENKQELDILINQLTDLSVDTMSCPQCIIKKFNIAPPLVVYHEIFADVYAWSNWLKIGGDYYELINLSKTRINSFNVNPTSNLYGTKFALPFIIEMTGKETENDLKLISQKAFLSYLNYLKENQ
jgi:hypothetical protein